MILVDASVIVAYLRRLDRRLGEGLTKLNLGICGVTRAELLQGTRNEKDHKKLLLLLEQFEQVGIGEEIWDRVGQRLRELRAKGIIVPFTDAVVATVAIEQGHEVWAFDAHFEMMAGIIPLKLYRSDVT